MENADIAGLVLKYGPWAHSKSQSFQKYTKDGAISFSLIKTIMLSFP